MFFACAGLVLAVFVAGILVGRNNAKVVTKVVTEVKAVEAKVGPTVATATAVAEGLVK